MTRDAIEHEVRVITDALGEWYADLSEDVTTDKDVLAYKVELCNLAMQACDEILNQVL